MQPSRKTEKIAIIPKTLNGIELGMLDVDSIIGVTPSLVDRSWDQVVLASLNSAMSGWKTCQKINEAVQNG